MSCRRLAQILLAILAIVPAVAAQDAKLWVGPNVNMVSGTTWPDGDPFLQRQNEASCAVSTRNSLHIFCGANDYRTVDIPGLPEGKPTGDSWIGTFQSLDGGGSWTSTLLPCYPQDESPHCPNLPPSLFVMEAAADPVVRAGVQGFFALSGIFFDRGADPASTVFISRFIDLNNDPYIPIQHIDTSEVWSYPTGSNVFIDKPWLAIDVARPGAFTWNITVGQNGTPVPQSIQCGPMYLAWAEIESGPTGITESKIMFSRSLKCGGTGTWSPPEEVSDSETITVNQGATIAIEPESGDVHVAWRQFNSVALPDGEGCVLGPGFWKTHPELWSEAVMQLGGVFYNHVQLLGIMETPPRGDATYILAEQLIPAKLNRISERNPILGAPLIAQADAWLAANPIGSKPKKPARDDGIDLAAAIKVFNVGFDPSSCVPATGEVQNAIMVASSGAGGLSFNDPVMVSALDPFDQGTTTYSFRSSAYPSMTADASKRLYLAWTTRGVASGAAEPDPVFGDARIVVSTSVDGGTNWTIPQPIDEPEVPGHQIKPSITFTSGKVLLGYYDFREDVSGVFEGYIADLPIPGLLRHTVDVRAAIADIGDAPVFTNYPVLQSSQTSRYPFIMVGNDEYDAEMAQLQWNPPNYPVFRGGTAAFFSDYIDLAAAPSFVSDGNGYWSYNTDPAGTATAFQVWTDDRDVIPPPDGDWTNYKPPTHANSGGASIFGEGETVPECIPGTDDEDRTGMRNQNVYSARVTEGLFVAAPGNSRPLGCLGMGGICPGDLFQRAYVIFVQNTTDEERSFRLRVENQPSSPGMASFDQFAEIPQEMLDVTVAPQSSASRTVFVSSENLHEAIEVSVKEIGYPGGGTIGGLESSVLLNPDPSNPAPYDLSLNQEEIYNPAILNPAILNPAILNPAILNPAILNPAILNPAILNPAIYNPAILNPAILNPAILNPAIYNPAILNPAILNPAIYNPAILNPAILNTTMTDMTWEVTNDGNSPVAYSLNLAAAGRLPSELIFQLMVYRVYTTPVANGCDLTEEGQHELLVNVNDPNFRPPSLFDPNVNDPDVVSFFLEPGDSALITLRVFDPDADNEYVFDPVDVKAAVVAQGVNTGDALLGDTQQPYTEPDVSVPTPVQMIDGRVQHTSTLLQDGRVLITGGFDPVSTLDSAEIYDPDSGIFTSTGSMASARIFHTATLLHDGRVLVVGKDSLGTGPNAEIFDPSTESFSPLVADSTVTRNGHCATLLADGRVLITGGVVGSATVATAEIFDPATDTFTVLPAMNSPRWSHTSTLLPTGEVLITGGFDGTADQDSAELFHPVTWSFSVVGTTMSDPRRFHSATLLPDGNVLLAGGYFDSSFVANTSADIYDSASGTIVPAGNMSQRRAAHTATLMGDGMVLIAGGTTDVDGSIHLLSHIEMYAWKAGTFIDKGDLVIPRTEHSAVRMPNGRVLITGGTTWGAPIITGTGSAELYVPANPAKFQLSGNLNTRRTYHTATLLADGDILVAGGTDQIVTSVPHPTPAVSSAERYNPSAGIFSPTGSLNFARILHTATRLQDGRVLVVGGRDQFDSSNTVATAELYDPIGETFSYTASMSVARSNHTATLLPDGRVLIAGGSDDSGATLFTAEIFDPVTESFSSPVSMGTARTVHAATLLSDGRVLLTGGMPNVPYANIFDPATDSFVGGALMNTGRSHHAATLLSDGRVLVTGGTSDLTLQWHDTAEIYDPVTNSFSYTNGNLNLPRRSHTSTRLPGGQVLITGGPTVGSILGTAAELFDPVTETFSLTDVMSEGRSLHTATTLSDGKVLLVGGWNIYGLDTDYYVPNRTTEIHDHQVPYTLVQRNALIALYNATGGASWTRKDNWRNGDDTDFNAPGTECTWWGVSCVGRRVVRLILIDNNLQGMIPTEIGDLAYVEYLSLGENQLTGSIPSEIGHLVDLNRLLLWDNQLIGGVPPQLGYLGNLEDISLYTNQLTGEIPPQLGNISSLRHIRLFNNLLTGEIPPELGDLSNLWTLGLYNNQLTGEIPPELGNLSNLVYLHVGRNQLDGEIPPELGNLSNVEILGFGQNQLEGEIPVELGSLSSVEWLSLHTNDFEGQIPTELGDLSTLESLSLDGNRLEGEIPSDLGKLSNLTYLSLHSNRLTGMIPSDLGNLGALEWLRLQGNRLVGPIPTQLGNLNQLFDVNGLDIRWNSLYTSDSTLRDFLDDKQVTGNWQNTQTVAPTGVGANSPTGNTVTLSWTRIDYQGHGGGYQVLYAANPGGDYTPYETTGGKLVTSMVVDGLDPGTTYYFVVRTVTDPHLYNQNTVVSEYSEEVWETTTGP